MSEVIWTPSADDLGHARVTHFAAWLREARGVEVDGPEELWRWSVQELEGFWAAVWEYFAIMSATPYERVLDRRVMPGAKWFEGARLNYAEHLLRHATEERPALVVLAEDEPQREVTWAALERDAGALARTLREAGVGRGDRVCGYLSNIPEAIVALVATVSVGAVWSVCAPDYGVAGVLSRFAQLEPTVLVAVDAYRYGGREFRRDGEIAELQAGLPTLALTVVVGRAGDAGPDVSKAKMVGWADAVGTAAPLEIEPVPFDHPLWVLFSSGTTGLPKGIVHSHGGITLEQLKQGALCRDIRPTDRWFFFASTSWAAWNTMVGALLVGCTAVVYDGSPGYPDLAGSWRNVAASSATVFGAGAAYLGACEKAGVDVSVFDLSALRLVLTTGSVLASSTWHWVAEALGEHVRLDCSLGATDICSGFVGGSPVEPVIVGELTRCNLGVRAETWNEDGEPVIDEPGELVITEPMPSMPTGFWNDPEGARYRESYFDVYPGVWRQGDRVLTTARGTMVVEGRSDATLNKAGVRMGSADVYAIVEALDGVTDSLIVGVDLADAGYYMPLFVVCTEGRELGDGLQEEITDAIRVRLSPRHVPDDIVAAPAIPRTRTGKKLEVPIKRIIAGLPLERAVNLASVDHPEAVRWYVRFASERLAYPHAIAEET